MVFAMCIEHEKHFPESLLRNRVQQAALPFLKHLVVGLGTAAINHQRVWQGNYRRKFIVFFREELLSKIASPKHFLLRRPRLMTRQK